MENTICQLSNPKNILAADGLKKFRQWKNLNKKNHASQKSPPPKKKLHPLFICKSESYIYTKWGDAHLYLWPKVFQFFIRLYFEKLKPEKAF